MKITSKSRYALKIVLALSEHGDEQIQRAKLSAETGLKSTYGDQVIGRLRDAGIVQATRGRGGGLKLAKQSNEIDVWEVFEAVEDNLSPVICLDAEGSCEQEASCNSADAWGMIHQKMKSSLAGISLEDLMSLDGEGPRTDSVE